MHKEIRSLLITLCTVIAVVILTFSLTSNHHACSDDIYIVVWLVVSLILLALTAVLSKALNFALIHITGRTEAEMPVIRKINLSCYAALTILITLRFLAVFFTKPLCGFAFASLPFYSFLFVILSGWMFIFSYAKK